MVYEKQSWRNGDTTTPLSAARLTHIEDGIEAASAATQTPEGRQALAQSPELSAASAQVATPIADAAVAAKAVPFASPILPRWRKAAALGRMGQKRPRILCIGDSLTSGVFSDVYGSATGSTNQGGPNSYPAQLARLLDKSGMPAYYGLAIPGHGANPDPRWTIGAGWVFQALGAGNKACLSTSTANAVLTLTPGIKADRYRVYFAANSGTGQMKAQATGGAESAPFGQNATGGTYFIEVSAAAASAANVVTITGISGTVFVTGIEWWDSTDPYRVTVMNGGVGTSKATDWASDLTHYARAITWIKAVAPDLAIIELGINDMAAGDTVANVTAAVTKIITAAEITADVILVAATPHPEPTSLDALNEAYRTATGVPKRPYVDLFQRYGHRSSTEGFMTVDKTHFNAVGYGDKAAAIAPLVLA